MNKPTVMIDGENGTEIALNKAIQGRKLTLKRATVFWDYNNITRSKGNNYVSIDKKKHFFPDGYYKFDTLVEKLKDLKVTLRYDEPTLKSTITTVDNPNLWKFDPTLGFPEGSRISAGDTADSPNIISVNNVLRTVAVICNMVNSHRNFTTDGKQSNVITTLPITTDSSLKG